MKEAIKILKIYGIQELESDVEKWADIPDKFKNDEIIDKYRSKIEGIKHAIDVLESVDNFYETFKNIEDEQEIQL